MIVGDSVRGLWSTSGRIAVAGLLAVAVRRLFEFGGFAWERCIGARRDVDDARIDDARIDDVDVYDRADELGRDLHSDGDRGDDDGDRAGRRRRRQLLRRRGRRRARR